MVSPEESVSESLTAQLEQRMSQQTDAIAATGLAEFDRLERASSLPTLISEHSIVLSNTLLAANREKSKIDRGMRATRGLRLAWRAAANNLPLDVHVDVNREEDPPYWKDDDDLELRSPLFLRSQYPVDGSLRTAGHELVIAGRRDYPAAVSGYSLDAVMSCHLDDFDSSALQIRLAVVDQTTGIRASKDRFRVSLEDEFETIYGEEPEARKQLVAEAYGKIRAASESGKGRGEAVAILLNAMTDKQHEIPIIGQKTIPAGTVYEDGRVTDQATHLEVLGILLQARKELAT